MSWAVLSHHVDLLPSFNLVAVLHVFNPGSLKISNCVRKFVPEGLDFNFPKRIIEIMPEKLVIYEKISWADDSHLKQFRPGFVFMELEYDASHSKVVELNPGGLLEVMPTHFLRCFSLEFARLSPTHPARPYFL